MTKHSSPFGTAAKLQRFNEAVGPNKLFGTGEAVAKTLRILAGGAANQGYHVSEVLDVLEAGIVQALDDSFKVQAEDTE
jgi:hypothetical protein